MTMLAFAAPTTASVCSLVFAILVCYGYLLGVMSKRDLWRAAGWTGFCVYFGLIAISAGADPVIKRGDIAIIIRGVLLLTYLLFLAWGAAWAHNQLFRQRPHN